MAWIKGLPPTDGTQFIAPSEWSGMDADIVQYDANQPHGQKWWSVKIEMPVNEPEYWMPIPALPSNKPTE